MINIDNYYCLKHFAKYSELCIGALYKKRFQLCLSNLYTSSISGLYCHFYLIIMKIYLLNEHNKDKNK